MKHFITAAVAPLLLTISMAQAGTESVGKKALPPPPAPPPPDNPLSFYDGRLVFDVQERLRFEYRDNNFDFDSGKDALTDDSWLLHRFRLGVKIKPLPFLTIYAQGQDSREFDSDRPNVVGQMGAEGDDAFDLRQGYVEIGDWKKFSVRVGRQIMQYGEDRLVGPGEWSNTGRTFDAIRLHYENGDCMLDAFTSSVVNFKDGGFNESDWIDSDAARDQFFSGIYFSTKALDFQTTDAYVFHLHEDGSGDTDFFTLGARAKADPAKLGGIDYELEAAMQMGDVKGRDLEAIATHAGIGYVCLKSAMKPRIFLEYNYASGDSNAGDGDVETFQNLFPSNHKFYGYMDLFSWQNLHEVALTTSIQPHKTLKAQLDYHVFWLADTNDAWYRANGVAQVRPIKGGSDSFAGSEIDLTLTWKPCASFALQAGYSHFFAGGYLGDTGAKSDADFAYLQSTIEF